jgi:hypothetical protein
VLLRVLRGGDLTEIADELRVHIVDTSSALLLQQQGDAADQDR